MAAGSLATASSDLFPPSFMRGTGRRKTKSTCQQYSGPLEEDAAGRWSKARGVDSEARLLTASAPHRPHHRLRSTSCQISGSVRFSWEREPYCELCVRDLGCSLLMRI
ncbi:uncharacterized protein LOC106998107 isoform X3 [Macaca mulatta]